MNKSTTTIYNVMTDAFIKGDFYPLAKMVVHTTLNKVRQLDGARWELYTSLKTDVEMMDGDGLEIVHDVVEYFLINRDALALRVNTLDVWARFYRPTATEQATRRIYLDACKVARKAVRKNASVNASERKTVYLADVTTEELERVPKFLNPIFVDDAPICASRGTAEQLRNVQAFLDALKLSAGQMTVIRCKIDGLSERQTADKLGRDVGSVSKDVRRIRAKIDKFINSTDADNFPKDFINNVKKFA